MSVGVDCPRPVQTHVSERTLDDLNTVTELLGVSRYEFLNNVVVKAVAGHIKVAEKIKSPVAKAELRRSRAEAEANLS